MRRWAPTTVAAAAMAAFAPVLRNAFVYWDDPTYVLDNPGIRGLTWENVRWALSATRGGFWQPLTWLSFQLDYSLWGHTPAGFHLTNLLLHAAAAAVFYFVALELLEGRWKAALLAALFFAVHPLRVESVAWATERKGLLSGLFFLLAALSYLRGRARLALAAFALSLAAKPTGLTLPFVLLIVETWRARRLPGRRVLLNLAPFFAVSVACAVATWLIARGGGLVTDIAALGPAWRLGRVLYGFCFYPAATIWPVSLSPYYPPKPWFGFWSWELFACAGALALAAAASRRRPALAAVLAAYAVMLLPMAGFVQQGQLYAACDRFSYLPCLGFALLFGAVLERRRALAGAWLLALALLSWRQAGVWRDTLTLWTSAYERAPSALALGEKGAALIKLGRAEEGVELLRRATESPRAQPTAYVNLGVALSKLGREAEARAAWKRGLAAAPSAELSALLGASLGDVALLEAALAAEPGHDSWRRDLAHAHHNLGVKLGDTAAAETHYREALRLEPDFDKARVNLGNILARRGNLAAAAELYRAALKTNPSSAEARANLKAVTR